MREIYESCESDSSHGACNMPDTCESCESDSAHGACNMPDTCESCESDSAHGACNMPDCEPASAAVIDRQEYYMQEGRHGYGSRTSKGPGTVHKVREALNLMRNQKFEVTA